MRDRSRERTPINEASPVEVPSVPTGGVPLEEIPEAGASEELLGPEEVPAEQWEACEETVDAWRERALRLQADMDNYRKQQRRLAVEHVALERRRLLIRFLHVADDLERALGAGSADAEALREGVRLTHRAVMEVLRNEGVETIRTEGARFDPELHDAVGTLPSDKIGLEPGMIAEEHQRGYLIAGRVLRPAKVTVSQ